MTEDKNDQPDTPQQGTGPPALIITPGPPVTLVSDSGFRVPWHLAAEPLLEYIIRTNARAEGGEELTNLDVRREDALYAQMGEDARKADLTVTLPAGIKVRGPIGSFLRRYTSIEYKSPADTCTMETLLRSAIYTIALAVRDRDGVVNPATDLGSVIVCAHKLRALFAELGNVRESKGYKGVYYYSGGSLPRTQFVVTSELTYEANGYIWFKWLREDLSEQDGYALMDRWLRSKGEERAVATEVAYVALQANPSVMKKLLEDKNMSDEVRKVIAPLVQEEMKPLQQKLEKAEERTEKAEKRSDALSNYLTAIMPQIKNDLNADQLKEAQELGVHV